MPDLLVPFGDDIWIADGTIVSVLGFAYPTRCAVIRLEQDALLVWSPVSLTADLKAQVDQLGHVTRLIAPNSFHHLFIAEWQSAYPEAQLFGTSALQRKRTDLHFSGVLGPAPDPAWAAHLDQVIVPHKLSTEVVFFHHASKTVIFTDLIQQFPRGWHKGWRALVARLDLMVGETPNVPRKFRLGFGPKPAARKVMDRIFDWQIERVIMAHGAPVTEDGIAVLRNSFAWLMK